MPANYGTNTILSQRIIFNDSGYYAQILKEKYNDFPDHKGRPGEVGGSLPKSEGTTKTGIDSKDRKHIEKIFKADKQTSLTFKADLQKALTDKNFRHMIRVGNMPEIYKVKEIGLPNLPIRLPLNIMYKAIRDKHDVLIKDLLNLPNLIADPYLVMKSRTEKDSIVAFIKSKDNSNRPIMTVFKEINRINFV